MILAPEKRQSKPFGRLWEVMATGLLELIDPVEFATSLGFQPDERQAEVLRSTSVDGRGK